MVRYWLNNVDLVPLGKPYIVYEQNLSESDENKKTTQCYNHRTTYLYVIENEDFTKFSYDELPIWPNDQKCVVKKFTYEDIIGDSSDDSVDEKKLKSYTFVYDEENKYIGKMKNNLEIGCVTYDVMFKNCENLKKIINVDKVIVKKDDTGLHKRNKINYKCLATTEPRATVNTFIICNCPNFKPEQSCDLKLKLEKRESLYACRFKYYVHDNLMVKNDKYDELNKKYNDLLTKYKL